MPKSRLEPMGDHLLVVDADRSVTIDGITLPDNVRQQEMVFGYVVAVGPECATIVEKATICYGPYAGKMVAVDGIEFRLLRAGQVEGRIVQTDDTMSAPCL